MKTIHLLKPQSYARKLQNHSSVRTMAIRGWPWKTPFVFAVTYCVLNWRFIDQQSVGLGEASMDFSFLDQTYTLTYSYTEIAHQSLCGEYLNLSTVPSISVAFQTNTI